MGTSFGATVKYGAVVDEEFLEEFVETLEDDDLYEFFENAVKKPDYPDLLWESTYVYDYPGGYALVAKDAGTGTYHSELKYFTPEDVTSTIAYKVRQQIELFWKQEFKRDFTGKLGWFVGVQVG